LIHVANSAVPDQIYVVGAGGLGREVASWLADSINSIGCKFGGFVDESIDSASVNLASKGISSSVITLDSIPKTSNVGFLIGIGNPDAREKFSNMLEADERVVCSLIHPSVIFGSRSEFQAGTIIGPNSSVSVDVSIGKAVLIGVGTNLGHDVEIGNYSTILGSNVINGDVKIHDKVTIGAGAVVHPNLVIESDSKVGIGSVVIKHVARGSTVFGNPAREII
jgi:sugar O-acyltransferase (sialic acid O-acetyltransferase NeuD family)